MGIVDTLSEIIDIPSVTGDEDALCTLLAYRFRDRQVRRVGDSLVVGEQPIDRPFYALYGHLDKQPEMEGWREDLGPWVPKREGDKLYGRGGADDGYAAFASLTAIEALAKSANTQMGPLLTSLRSTATGLDSLLGARDLWLKAELYSYGSGAPSGGTLTNTAQLTRYDVQNDSTTFSIGVNFLDDGEEGDISSPATLALLGLGLAGLNYRRRQSAEAA